MNEKDLRTSCIEFISSLHGRQRRAEREISVRDLQAAVKYGVKKKQIGGNYKIIYNNIVYITDDTCTKEVTSYTLIQLPLEKVTLNQQLERQISEQQRRISSGEVDVTSHTVIIVDQSASMNNSDCFGNRSRSRGAYYTIASEMIAKPLSLDQLGYTDVVTIIEMRNEAIVNRSICMEPISWILHNKLVDLANDPLRGQGHGNYISSLEEAFSFLSSADNGNCALLLFLLSDGAPSDSSTLYKGVKHSRDAARSSILATVRKICLTFTERLTFGAFGFAHSNGEAFTLLKDMCDAAQRCGSIPVFSSGLDVDSLRKALFRMSTSLMTTLRTLCSIVQNSIVVEERPKKKRRTDITKDTRAVNCDSEVFNKIDYNFHHEVKRYRYVTNMKAVKDLSEVEFQEISFAHPSANGIAINKKFAAEGAEKMALFATEVNVREPVGQPLIAKVSVNDNDQSEFHKYSAKTQMEARRLSKKFNETIADRKLSVKAITFLEVHFYECSNMEGYLVERRLDVKRYQKFNDSCGGVINMNKLKIKDKDLEALPECDESDQKGDILPHHKDQIIDEDVPQAFSHWTYQYTHAEKLVCDLQGVLTNRFELTDPAIHSKEGKRFGLTDKGRKGMRDFFETHKCNPLCKALSLKHAVHRYRDNK